MSLDFATLSQLRRTHPGWRLLVADHAPLVVSFLQQTFIEPNVRVMAQPELESRLEDLLFQLREREGDKLFPRSAENIWMTGRSTTRAGCASSTRRRPMRPTLT